MYKENYVETADSELYHVSGASGGYDGLNRLTTFARGTLSTSTGGVMLDTISSPSTTQSWDLDALGNQLSVTTDGTEQTRTQNGQNQTTSVTTGDTTNNLTYDANGATTTDEDGRVWKYDAWGDPVSVTSSSGTLLETDAFDALGRRITVTTYSGGMPATTDLYYTTAGQVIEEDRSGEPISQTVYGPNYVNSIIEVDQATGSPGTLNQRIYVQQDANYNVTSVTDTSGNVLERHIYSPYGEQTVLNADGTVKGDGTPASSSYNLPVGFQGMLFDPVTSDNLTPNRVYDPMLGTWTSEDPSGYGDGMNLYQAFDGDPAIRPDPAGLAAQPKWTLDAELKGSALNVTDPDVAHAYAEEACDIMSYHWDAMTQYQAASEWHYPGMFDGPLYDDWRRGMKQNADANYAANQYWWGIWQKWVARETQLRSDASLAFRNWVKIHHASYGRPPTNPAGSVKNEGEDLPPDGATTVTIYRTKTGLAWGIGSSAVINKSLPGTPALDKVSPNVPLNPAAPDDQPMQNEAARRGVKSGQTKIVQGAAQGLNEILNGVKSLTIYEWTQNGISRFYTNQLGDDQALELLSYWFGTAWEKERTE